MGQKGHATGMAGEFHVMELLYRKGHQPAITLGNAKAIDILTLSPSGKRYEVSVKAMRGGGKWGIGVHDYSNKKDLVFVLLYYKKFDDIEALPEVWIVPAEEAENIKLPWHSQYGLYIYKNSAGRMEKFKDAWHYLD